MQFLRRTPKHDPEVRDAMAVRAALDKAQAVIWFDLDGTILDANENFCAALGYPLEEIRGQHHRLFVTPDYGDSAEYAAFWTKLGRGQLHSGEFQRVAKDGRTIWIEASYNPVFDNAGRPIKVVKFAIDVTEAKMRAADDAGKIAAISKSQAVIEFDLDGTILDANENFLAAVGYTLDEIRGQHHRMFVPSDYADSTDYRMFWSHLARGEFQAGEFKRVGKGGREIWIQATYNPIFDASGNPVKVVKFASDITEAKRAAADADGQLAAISRSQAVIEFNLDGTILTANENFLDALGYGLDEIQGRHHRMFVEPAEAESPEYRAFWKKLATGEFHSAEYKRLAKGGREIWIQATYNPILDPEGKPYKVVKYASELTERKLAMSAFADGLRALSEGDLSVRLPNSFTGEFAGLARRFNETTVRLQELVTGILEIASTIAEETNAIAATSKDLSQRGERQAATVEETSAAMEEISSTVKSTASNAQTAASAAKRAAEDAERGGAVVKDAVEAMGRIEDSSRQISKIVEVIDSISFQTNLLALNAGVEAARAGDAGRGFAVVASEVRALAQRATDAAREINELIETSNTEVATGSGLVNDSGKALTEIVAGVLAIVGNVDEISIASSEQAAGVGEVTQAVTDIDATTQQTAALAEESAAAAAQLARRAAELRELVGFFRSAGAKAAGVTRVDRPKTAAAPEPPRAEPAPPKKVAAAGAARLAAVAIEDDGWSDF